MKNIITENKGSLLTHEFFWVAPAEDQSMSGHRSLFFNLPGR